MRPFIFPIVLIFCYRVRLWSRWSIWGQYPIFILLYLFIYSLRYPKYYIIPEVCFNLFNITLKKVVFPEPLWPNIPIIYPCLALKYIFLRLKFYWYIWVKLSPMIYSSLSTISSIHFLSLSIKSLLVFCYSLK